MTEYVVTEELSQKPLLKINNAGDTVDVKAQGEVYTRIVGEKTFSYLNVLDLSDNTEKRLGVHKVLASTLAESGIDMRGKFLRITNTGKQEKSYFHFQVQLLSPKNKTAAEKEVEKEVKNTQPKS